MAAAGWCGRVGGREALLSVHSWRFNRQLCAAAEVVIKQITLRAQK